MLVTGINPTTGGEGKTTTSIGLTQALRRRGVRATAALREPSVGPVMGIKGGGTGGGGSQIHPADQINLHFTGDLHAVTAANNLLAAAIDNSMFHGNPHGLDPRRITWRRCLDMNDRALRSVVVGLGGTTDGVPREEGFDITPASEVMAILSVTSGLEDLRQRLGDVIVGYTREIEPVRCRDLGVDVAMTVLLRQALQPNLVQTSDGGPAFVHGGPFANIALGCNSLMATRAALATSDVTVTEAGFGSDLGAEKFFNIYSRIGGLRPEVAVIVATARALKQHGGVDAKQLEAENVEALRAGPCQPRRAHRQRAAPRAHAGRRGQPLPLRQRRRDRGHRRALPRARRAGGRGRPLRRRRRGLPGPGGGRRGGAQGWRPAALPLRP